MILYIYIYIANIILYKGGLEMKIEKTTNLSCFRDFSHGAVIKTNSGRSLGATCDPREAENIIRTYFQTELFPEPVHVYFGGEIGQCGTWGYTFNLY